MLGPILTSDPARLRPWRPDEAARYVAMRDDLVFRWTTEDPALSETDAAESLRDAATRPDLVSFAIADSSDAAVGNLAIVIDGDTARLSYWTAPGARGRGVATAALRTAGEWLGATLSVVRLELEIHPDNTASCRVAEKAGYRLEGRRESCVACAADDGTVAVYARRP